MKRILSSDDNRAGLLSDKSDHAQLLNALFRRRLTAIFLSLIVLTGPSWRNAAAADQLATTPGQNWEHLFDPDPAVRDQTWKQAESAGVVDSGLRPSLDQLATHDAQLRSRLSQAVIEGQYNSTSPLISMLLSSKDIELRRMGLRLCSPQYIDEDVSATLKQMAAHETDAVLLAEARLRITEIPVSTAQPAPMPAAMTRIPAGGIVLASASLLAANTPDFSASSVVEPQQAVTTAFMIDETGGNAGRTGIIHIPDSHQFEDEGESIVPPILQRPLLTPDEMFNGEEHDQFEEILLAYPMEAPLGFTGRSGILGEDVQQDSHFVPVPDRWRIGSPAWDRYNKGHPHDDDYPYAEGHWWDPYRQNVLKGDYPFIGQHTFFRLTAQANILNEYRQLPVATTPFESTASPNQEEFFGRPNQYFTTNYFKMSFEVFHGNAGFKPVDWSIRVTPIFNINYLNVQELGVVNPNVRNGRTRYDDFMALEEYFVEAKLADLSADYDFVSARVGSQPFTSDFRGFIFSDVNRAVRLFGTRSANRDEFNLIFFDQVEKDTNSQLNTFHDRNQNTLIANYYRQDFVFPGYTAELSMHYNRDGPSTEFDTNGFLVRPDPAGVALPHRVDAVYLGFAGEGHIGRFNIANALYWVVGRDSMNPIAGQRQDINAKMGAIELSYDRDWIRFRASFFHASGDDNAYDKQAKGFDTIFDNPNFAGGQFSFWQRQQIQLFGVSLVNRNSLVPDLRSSKFQGQSNFVNPGLNLFNLGMDFELTPKLKLITNANYLEFDRVGALEAFAFQGGIDKSIGVDLSAGMEYRPLHSDNVVIEGGYAALIPGKGFDDLYGKTEPFTTANAANYKASTLHQVFMQMAFTY